MGLWEQFGNAFQNENRIPNIPDIPKIGVSGTLESNCGDNEDIGDKYFNPKNEHGQEVQKPPAPKDGNAMLAGLDLRNVRPWTEGRCSPRCAQKAPGPQATAAPEAAKSDNGQAPDPPHGQQYQGEPGEQPAPISMRWILCPCTLVPIVLELEGDITGPLTWQAGQFDDHVRALCDEHGDQLRAFLSTLPGRRWESWQENALDIADRWDASQGIQQRGQQHD